MEAIPEVQPDLAFQVSHGGHPTSATRIDVPVSCRAGMSPNLAIPGCFAGLPLARLHAGARTLIAAISATLSGAEVCHVRSEEHTSELQSLMRISYAVFCLKKKKRNRTEIIPNSHK